MINLQLPLKWPGGKQKLLSQYKKFIPSSVLNYHEPFFGGGAMFFSGLFATKNSFLSDANQDLINTYICIRDNLHDLIHLFMDHQEKHSEEYYYLIRESEPRDSLKRAARFIYLNKTCFNGLYRVNSKGKFNVPMGGYSNPNICNKSALLDASSKLSDCELSVRDFREIKPLPGDFVFLDPPYYPISKSSNFTAYTSEGFGKEDHFDLKKLMSRMSGQGVLVMQSNSDCDFIRNLYSEFKIHEITAPRCINGNPAKRNSINEVLITSY